MLFLKSFKSDIWGQWTGDRQTAAEHGSICPCGRPRRLPANRPARSERLQGNAVSRQDGGPGSTAHTPFQRRAPDFLPAPRRARPRLTTRGGRLTGAPLEDGPHCETRASETAREPHPTLIRPRWRSATPGPLRIATLVATWDGHFRSGPAPARGRRKTGVWMSGAWQCRTGPQDL